MKAPYRLILCLLAVLAATLFFAACGGGNSKSSKASLDAYFQQLDVVGNEFLAALNTRAEPAPSASVSEQVNVFQEFARTLAGKIGSAKDKLDKLQPPPEVRGAHVELVSAVDNALAVTRQIEADLNQVISIQDLQAVAARPDALAAFDRFRAACRTLQQLATDNKVAVDLNCDGGVPVGGG